MKTEDIMPWLKRVGGEYKHSIDQVPLRDLAGWHIDSETGNFVHDRGWFFSIEGLEVNTNWGVVHHWSQPIIHQPEVGFLGILAKRFNGVLYFLMQAKAEPGNINGVQLSPTLQATKSNFTRAHGGAAPKYLKYFTHKRKTPVVEVLLDQLQSEQGARFWKKRNRNIIIELKEDIKVDSEFCWLSLGQIKILLRYDNVINMDTRTVISGIPFGNSSDQLPTAVLDGFGKALLLSELDEGSALHSTDDIVSWITEIKFNTVLDAKRVPLNDLQDWVMDEYSIHHKDNKYFSVIGVNVSLGNREVHNWSQPLVKSAQEGIIAFIIKRINGVYHFLVQAKLECGNLDLIELAPTVQCLTGNYRKGLNEYEVEFLDYVTNPQKFGATVRYSAFQSEEGGRFFKEQNKNMIIEVGSDFTNTNPGRYIWMTLRQLKTFVRFNNYLNIQSRSLLSAVTFIETSNTHA